MSTQPSVFPANQYVSKQHSNIKNTKEPHNGSQITQITAKYQPVNIVVLSAAPAYQANAALWLSLELHSVNVSATQELLNYLEHQAVDFILLDPRWGKQRFLDNIKRIQPATRIIFIIEEACPNSLLKLNIRGHSFTCLAYDDTPRNLARALQKNIFPRTEQRYHVENIFVSFETHTGDNKQRWKRRLMDVSTHGFSWQVNKTDNCTALTPGTIIYNLRIYKKKTADSSTASKHKILE